MQQVKHYINLLKSLRRAPNLGGAPHKPILLLAVFSLIRKGIITSNKIEISPELVLEFKEYWLKFVQTPHTANFALPFFQLSREPFWFLIAKPGASIPVTSSNSIKSFKALRDTVLFAQLDNGLFELLNQKENNYLLSELLISTYFPDQNNKGLEAGYNLFSQLEFEILNDNKAVYQTRIEQLQATLNEEEFTEEVFVRCGIFKREIPKLYNYTCAISGMRIETSTNIQMVDACHIIPFSISHDDTIGNGICLSPNLHRAFDRGLLTITPDYTVNISSRMIENSSAFSLLQFQGKHISLPTNKSYHPNPENLESHFNQIFLR